MTTKNGVSITVRGYTCWEDCLTNVSNPKSGKLIKVYRTVKELKEVTKDTMLDLNYFDEKDNPILSFPAAKTHLKGT